MRELKALEIAARMRVAWEDGAWSVPSQSGNGKYRVTLDGPSCTCEDFQLRQESCKHVIAARLVCERDHGGKAPAIDTSAVPKKKTYSQNWKVYNEAQSIEKHRFQVLLQDLCKGIEEPPLPKTGRRPHLVKDAIFAMAFKVYSTFSSRRFSCDLKDAHEKGFLSRPVPGVKVSAFLENADFTPLLSALIIRSSLPLKSVEVDFAPDSSGFSTSRFIRWFDHKYGVTRQEHDWVKVHLMCGVKTNIVTAVEIHGRDAGDSPQFIPLLKVTAENFTIREVSADKGYTSVDNTEAVFACGGIPFIAFKSNATGGAGGLWEKMFHYYSFNRDEFLKRYHKRSNVESTISMIKAKFRDHVRSKTDVAMVNEVLCKILCHNICVVIQSQCELGIEATFWPEDSSEKAAVLPMIRPG